MILLQKCDKKRQNHCKSVIYLILGVDTMQRFISDDLIKWKNSKDRKPLILKGARQVGKTYILKEFGTNNYENIAYFNFDRDEGLRELFLNTKDPKRIIEQLSLANGKKINPNPRMLKCSKFIKIFL